MTARDMEIIDETEIFTEALVASVAPGEITVDQLKRHLGEGLAYVAAQDADDNADWHCRQTRARLAPLRKIRRLKK
jgi:hypothetical protein